MMKVSEKYGTEREVEGKLQLTLDLDEFAKAIDVTPTGLYYMIKKGKMPPPSHSFEWRKVYLAEEADKISEILWGHRQRRRYLTTNDIDVIDALFESIQPSIQPAEE